MNEVGTGQIDGEKIEKSVEREREREMQCIDKDRRNRVPLYQLLCVSICQASFTFSAIKKKNQPVKSFKHVCPL